MPRLKTAAMQITFLRYSGNMQHFSCVAKSARVVHLNHSEVTHLSRKRVASSSSTNHVGTGRIIHFLSWKCLPESMECVPTKIIIHHFRIMVTYSMEIFFDSMKEGGPPESHLWLHPLKLAALNKTVKTWLKGELFLLISAVFGQKHVTAVSIKLQKSPSTCFVWWYFDVHKDIHLWPFPTKP